MDWVDQIIQRIFRPDTYLVIGVIKNVQTVYPVMIISRKKGEIYVTEKRLYSDIEELRSFIELHSDLPGILAIDTEKVIDGMEVPQGELSEFFVQEHKNGLGDFTSFCRSNYLHDQTRMFEGMGIKIVHVTIGAIAGQAILPILQSKGIYTPTIGTKKFSDNGSFVPSEDSESTTVIEGEQFTNQELYIYSGMVHLLLTESDPPGSYVDFHYGKFKRTVGKIAVPALFVLLLLNAVLLFYFDDQVKELSQEVSGDERLKTQMVRFRKDIQTYQARFSSRGSTIQLSRLYDDVGETVPSSVVLTSFQIFPYDLDRRQSRLTFDNSTLVIEGELDDMVTYADWLKTLKQLEWVSEITDQSVAKVEDGAYYNFRVKIVLA